MKVSFKHGGIKFTFAADTREEILEEVQLIRKGMSDLGLACDICGCATVSSGDWHYPHCPRSAMSQMESRGKV